ncbi:hypothetical protein TIFTF001_024021 [Ficus carica]|uniref:Cytochrome P450 n=1 Tax=Ficus carica TaxID=3494 RepID=A0AA88DGM7_FICCA|nr:hypothetical protein TIFTF001_024021 [Ficus carica]
MDKELIQVLIGLFSILATTIVFFICLKLGHDRNKKRVPPGNMGLPWIGETWEFYKAQKRNRLFEEFIQPRITKHGKVFKTSLMGSPTVIVNGANANRFILSNEFKMVVSSWPSASVQLMGKNSIMEKQGERHRCLRGIISTTFGDAGLETLVPKICRSILSHLGQKWNCQEEISLYRSTKTMTFTIVFECLLGINVQEGMLETFERILEGVFTPAIQFPGSKFSRAKKARSEIHRKIVEVVREKRQQMEGCGRMQEKERVGMLLSRLVAGLIRGDISEEEVVDNVVLLVFAAHDTTSFAIAMTFKMLAQHPNCHAQLLQGKLSVTINRKI